MAQLPKIISYDLISPEGMANAIEKFVEGNASKTETLMSVLALLKVEVDYK